MKSESLDALFEELIEKDHPHLANLIEAWYVDSGMTVQGREVIAKTRKIGGAAAVMMGRSASDPNDEKEEGWLVPEPAFVITVWKGAFEALPKEAQTALLDHELCHCGVTTTDEGGDRYYIKPHDVEEFHAVTNRHGSGWRNALGAAITQAKSGQLSLDGESAA